jgi:hypothetical protein
MFFHIELVIVICDVTFLVSAVEISDHKSAINVSEKALSVNHIFYFICKSVERGIKFQDGEGNT